MVPKGSQEAVVAGSCPKVESPAKLWLWPLAMGVGVYFVAIYFAPKLLLDPDTFSHIAVGRWIIEHRALPFHDPFSYTFQGKLWVPHEWLSEVVFASIYRYFGWGGICAITALSFGVALALLTRRLMDWLDPPRPAIAAAFAYFLSEHHVLARPHVLAMPFMVLWISGLISAREAKRAPSFALLPVMTIWCNLHGGFILGLVFCVLLGCEAVFDAKGHARWEVARHWGVFTVCAVGCALISPNGFDGILFPLRMMQMTSALTLVGEWRSPDFHEFHALELWIAMVIVGGFSFGIRLPVTRVLMVLLLLHQALFSMRNAELLGFIAPLLVAAPLARQLAARQVIAHQPIGASTAYPAFGSVLGRAIVLCLFAAIIFIPSAALLNARGIRPAQNIAPESALTAARSAGLVGPVFNSYNFGGYLTFKGIPTFIDGRADPYTDEFIDETFAAEDRGGKPLIDLLDQYKVKWTLLPPRSAAAGLLDHLDHWERVYGDEYAVVHRRVF